MAPRAARDISYPSCARAQRRQMSVEVQRTTSAQTRELARHNNELVNDVRVSPRRRPRRTRCDTGHVDPGVQPVDLLRRYTEQQEINVIPTRTAVAVHRTHIAWRMSARRDAPGIIFISKEACQMVAV